VLSACGKIYFVININQFIIEIIMNKIRRSIFKIFPLALFSSAFSIKQSFALTSNNNNTSGISKINSKIQSFDQTSFSLDVANFKYHPLVNDTITRSLNSKLSDSISILDLGGSRDSDNHDAFMKAISERVGCLYIPSGTWPYSGLIDVGSMRIVGTGPYQAGLGSRLLAIDGTSVFKLGSGSFLSGLYFDGNGNGATDGKGEYGIILTHAQSIILENVHIRHFNKYGVVFDMTQNSALINVNAQYNAINFLFNNGARNIVLLGCNAALDLDEKTGRNPNHRNILMAHISDEPLFTIKATSQSNSRIQFFGGIYEYANYADANIEFLNAGSRGFNDILMEGVEITEASDSGYLISLKSGSLKLNNCEFNGNDRAKTIFVGKGALLTIPGDGSFGSDGRGKLAPFYGLDIDEGGSIIAGYPGAGIPSATNFNNHGPLKGWRQFNGNEDSIKIIWQKKRNSVQVSYNNTGQGAQKDLILSESITPVGTLVNVKGYIEIISGASIDLCILLNDNSKRILLSKAMGGFDIFYRIQGDEKNKILIIANAESSKTGKGVFEIGFLEVQIH
jgi:hypothetical protein